MIADEKEKQGDSMSELGHRGDRAGNKNGGRKDERDEQVET